MIVELSYTNRRGAGVMMRLPGAEAVKRIQKLRCEAAIRLPGDELRVGGVDRMDYSDDKRVKWNWWYDPSILDDDQK